MYRCWTLALGTYCLVACSATNLWSQQETFLKEPVHAKANMKSSPKFDDRVFVYCAEPIAGEILDHNVDSKEVVLGIGAKDGVRFGHAFNIFVPESEECVGVAKVMELDKGRCIAKVVSIEDKDKVEESLKGFSVICAAPKPNVRKAYAIELGFNKTIWQTESLENKIIRSLLEIGDGEFPILIRQEN